MKIIKMKIMILKIFKKDFTMDFKVVNELLK